jgi:uncharacterized protein YqeY
MDLKTTLTEAMKTSMRNKEKSRLETIRLIQAMIKQAEVDQDKREHGLQDSEVLAIMDKMLKQRRDSIQQFVAGNRQDLADKEAAEIIIIQEFLPQALTDVELAALIDQAMQAVDDKSMAAMGKVMAILKPQIQGRADVAKVSGQVKAALGL